MADEKHKVFISAVSGEFESARNALAADLRARGCEVKVQSDFTQGEDNVTLLRRLYNYIRNCHSVVCLIGKRAGAYPPARAADHFKSERYQDALPKGMTEASYTQWEYLFGRFFNRNVYTYFASDDWKPDKPGDADERQHAFVEWLEKEGVHWTPFSTIDQLARAVLKEDFSLDIAPPPPPPTKPIVLPYPSLGPLFKGREGFMQQLHESLHRGDGKTAITARQAVYGLGGIGKTRAAVEYAWAHQDDYSALLFVVAETPEALRANLVALTATLAAHLAEAPDNERLAAVLGWLRSNPGWLLILDNVDSKPALAAVEGLLNELHGGQVLVTSRLSDFSANFAPLPLDVLSLNDAIAFLLERTEGRRRKAADDEARAREIATEVDRLALALEQAAAYIAKRRLTFEAYLEQWRAADHSKVLDWFDETVTGYKRAVAITWQTSVAQLTEPGRRMLERLAWLAPERIPEFLLDVPVPSVDNENLQDALDDLASYSLVLRDAEGPFFLLHRLVQDVTRRSLAGRQRQSSLEEGLGWINAAFPRNTDKSQSWPRAEPLLSHARAVVQEADSAGIVDPTARLMNQLATMLHYKALYAEAEPLFQRFLSIREKVLGPDHPDLVTSLNNLAVLYTSQGRYSEAEPLLERALAIREKAFRPDHPFVALSLNNLAGLYQSQKRYPEARALYERCLAIYENALAPDDPNVALALNNLGGLYWAEGRYPEAEPLLQRALAIRENVLGPDDLDTGTSLGSLGELYRTQRRYREAEPLLRRALVIREKTPGPNHDDIANALNNLGLLYSSLGRNEEASTCMQRCASILLTISSEIGRNHPYLELAIANYSRVLSDFGKSESEIEAEIKKLLHRAS